jgi:hypothetical protein
VFAGNFTLEAAAAVADPGSFEIVDEIANLVGKSLVSADPRSEVPQYRLLDTTRLYAFEKLKSSGQLQQVARRHAKYYLAVFANAEAESESGPQPEWLAIYGRHLDNVRVAFDWAFSTEGDPHIVNGEPVGAERAEGCHLRNQAKADPGQTIWRIVSDPATCRSSRHLVRPAASQTDSDCSRRQCPSSKRTIGSEVSARSATRFPAARE